MTDRHSPLQRSFNMSRIRAKNSKPELMVRHIVHSLGFRYRLHKKDIPGTPDLVFPRLHKIIFVHGCFWHRHDCPEGTLMPSSNVDYWKKKFDATLNRDTAQLKLLAEDNWSILVVWQCQLKDREKLIRTLLKFLISKE